MKKYLINIFVALFYVAAYAGPIPTAGSEGVWIAPPDADGQAYGVYYFRKQIQLKAQPKTFCIYATGDNRYKLYVNGRLVAAGPARSDVAHWNIEEIDLAAFLHKGENVVSAVVWNDGAAYRPVANTSYRTGLLIQGTSDETNVLNTDGSWLCKEDKAYKPLRVFFPNYYVAGAGELVDMNLTVTDWQTAGASTVNWQHARPIRKAVYIAHNAVPDASGWLLQYAPIPLRELRTERLKAVRQSTGVKLTNRFLTGNSPVTIPAHTSCRIVLDQSYLTNAYFTLRFSGGKNSTLSIGYQEALFEKYPDKGNRNEVEGKVLIGRKDSILSSGAAHQVFETLAWRTYRYVVLNVNTADSPLTLDDVFGTFTGYPYQLKASLQTTDRTITDIFNIGWRTLRACTIETYMDCPYYEQLQYLGDTRIQALITLYNTGDDRIVKNFLAQADMSRLPEGLTQSRYPSDERQLIPAYSLSYIGALYDYMMYGNDSIFVSDKLQGVRDILHYFQRYQKEDGSIAALPWWNFTDWVDAPGWNNGVSEPGSDGCAAVLDLQLLYAYESAAALEAYCGMQVWARLYADWAEQLKQTIRRKYWDNGRKLFADRAEHDHFSQHTNGMAILTSVVEGDQAHQIGRQLLEDSTLAPASIYFKYFLYQALVKAGYGNDYMNWLDKWKENIQLGLTTWAEISDVNRARSDCHAWGASPNIEFFRTVLGIDSDAPGFRRVKITPHLGNIKNIGGTMPHPAGMIQVSYQQHNHKLNARISLPKSVSGTFVWKGRTYHLRSGNNNISAE
jgi:alpha-L-rhamnosidase